MTLPDMTNIDWTAIDWGSAGAYVLAAVVALVILGSAIRNLTTRAAKTVKGRGPIVLAIASAVLLTALSADSILRVLRDVMNLHDWEAWGFFAVLDIALLASAMLAWKRRRMLADKGSTAIPVDGIAVWIIAILEGVIGSWAEPSVQGTLIRFVAPLLAAWLYERALALEEAEIRGVSSESLSRVRAGIVGLLAQIKRTAARWGLITTSDQTIADVQWSRWARRVDRNVSRWERIDDQGKRARRERQIHTLIAGMSQRGLLDQIDQRDRLVARSDNRRAIVARLIGRPEVIDGDATDRTIDAGVIDQDDRPTTPVDRPENDRPDVAIDHPRPTDTATDRPTEPVDQKPTDRPVTARPTRSITPTPNTRPTNPEPTDQQTDRAIEGELIDRPGTDRPTRRRSKEENERLIRGALVAILADADATEFPSHGQIAKAAGVSKSTVAGYLGRVGLTGETTLTTNVINVLPVHNI